MFKANLIGYLTHILSLIALSRNTSLANEAIRISQVEIDQQAEMYQYSLLPNQKTNEDILKELVAKKVIIKLAYDSNLSADPAVKTKIEDIIYHAQLSKDLAPLFKNIIVTEKDIETYYSSFKEFDTSQILLRLPVNPSSTMRSAAMDKAFKLLFNIKNNPEKFSTLSKEFGQSANAYFEGRLGFLPSIRLLPEYYDAIKAKTPNAIVGPIQTKLGIHIIKIHAVKPYNLINMDLYRKIVYDIKRDKIIDDYLKQKGRGAVVQIY